MPPKIPSKVPGCQEILSDTTGQQKTRKPYLASGFKLLLNYSGMLFGGGGGSRTRVRKYSPVSIYMLSPDSLLIVPPLTSGQAALALFC